MNLGWFSLPLQIGLGLALGRVFQQILAWLARMVGVVLLVAIVTGCSLAPTDQVLEKLANSERSWCVTITSIYGTVKMGGTGVANGKAICNGEGLAVDNAAVPPAAIVVPAQPRILQQEPPTFREVEPAPTQRRAPAIRPQSWPSSRMLDVLETSAGMLR